MNFFAMGAALAEGRLQRNQIDVQRDIEQFNIKNQEQNAALKAQQAGAAEEMQRREGRRLLGSQRAAIAQSGVGFLGSSSDIMRQSAAAAELDALNIRYAGDLERLGILNDIEMRKYNDKVLKQRGKLAMRMRWGNAASALFGGSAGSSWADKTAASSDTGAYGQNWGAFTPNSTWASSSRGVYGGFGASGPSSTSTWKGPRS